MLIVYVVGHFMLDQENPRPFEHMLLVWSFSDF